MTEKLILCGLSTFILVLMLKDLDGPFDIFNKLRTLLCKYDDMNVPQNFFAKLFDCPWCLSTWVAGGVTLLMLVLPVDIFIWLSAISIASIIYIYVMT